MDTSQEKQIFVSIVGLEGHHNIFLFTFLFVTDTPEPIFYLYSININWTTKTFTCLESQNIWKYICQFSQLYGAHSTVECSTVQYSAVQYSTVQYSAVHAVQYSTVQCSAVQYSTVQYSEVQYQSICPVLCFSTQGPCPTLFLITKIHIGFSSSEHFNWIFHKEQHSKVRSEKCFA